MPNWCENRITIYAVSEEQAKEIAELLKSSDDNLFDFNKVIPRPESLNITSGGFVKQAASLLKGEIPDRCREWNWLTPEEETPESYLKALCEHVGDGEKLSREAAAYNSNLEKYGHADWYSWSIKNWGTKWAPDVGAFDWVDETTMEFRFDTAWSPPTPVIEALRERFPEASITAFFDEPGMQAAGYY